jgi:hypothetical protein
MPKGLSGKTFRNTALALTSVMSSYPHAAEALTNSLAERIREILPAGEFEVEACSGIVNIQGIGQYRGSSMASMSVLLLGMPGDISDKLDMIFMSQGEEIQEFLTDLLGEPWPARGAKPHVRVTQDTVQLWWGGPTKDQAVVKLRPILRRDLGL